MKTKTINLGILSLLTTVIPVITVVSCGEPTKDIKNSISGVTYEEKLESYRNQENVGYFLQHIKDKIYVVDQRLKLKLGDNYSDLSWWEDSIKKAEVYRKTLKQDQLIKNLDNDGNIVDIYNLYQDIKRFSDSIRLMIKTIQTEISLSNPNPKKIIENRRNMVINLRKSWYDLQIIINKHVDIRDSKNYMPYKTKVDNLFIALLSNVVDTNNIKKLEDMIKYIEKSVNSKILRDYNNSNIDKKDRDIYFLTKFKEITDNMSAYKQLKEEYASLKKTQLVETNIEKNTPLSDSWWNQGGVVEDQIKIYNNSILATDQTETFTSWFSAKSNFSGYENKQLLDKIYNLTPYIENMTAFYKLKRLLFLD